MDIVDITLKLAGVAGGVIGSIAAAVIWTARHTLVTREDHDVLRQRVQAVETVIHGLKISIDALPTSDDMAELKASIAAINGTLEQIKRPLETIINAHIEMSIRRSDNA